MMGRPTIYTPELVEKARAYVSGGYQDEGDIIPSHAGLAATLGIHRSTLYAWSDDKDKDISDILEECNIAQERKLLTGGLSGDFNAAITKLALGKQGYSDKVENDTLHSFDMTGLSERQLDDIINSDKS